MVRPKTKLDNPAAMPSVEVSWLLDDRSELVIFAGKVVLLSKSSEIDLDSTRYCAQIDTSLLVLLLKRRFDVHFDHHKIDDLMIFASGTLRIFLIKLVVDELVLLAVN